MLVAMAFVEITQSHTTFDAFSLLLQMAPAYLAAFHEVLLPLDGNFR